MGKTVMLLGIGALLGMSGLALYAWWGTVRDMKRWW